jgi:hypothetical protein
MDHHGLDKSTTLSKLQIFSLASFFHCLIKKVAPLYLPVPGRTCAGPCTWQAPAARGGSACKAGPPRGTDPAVQAAPLATSRDQHRRHANVAKTFTSLVLLLASRLWGQEPNVWPLNLEDFQIQWCRNVHRETCYITT